jgi:hypothetical protein
LSLTEDAAVVGGLVLIKNDPIIALVVFSLAFLAILYVGPKLWRALKVHLWLVWKKLVAPAADDADVELVGQLPPDLHIAFHDANLLGEKILWAVPCASGSAKRIPGNMFGYLVATAEDQATLWFVAKRRWRRIAEELNLETYKVVHEPKFLSENLSLYSLERKPKYLFVFNRAQTALVKQLAATLQKRLTPAPVETAQVS